MTLSAQLRKMIAQYSFETVPQSLPSLPSVERGIKPTATAIRQAVLAKGHKWPWRNDGDVQAVRRARTDYMAGKFDGVAIEGGSRGKHAFRMGASGPRPKFEHVEKELDHWIQHELGPKQISRLTVIRRALDFDPCFFDHHQCQSANDLRKFMLRASDWYYHGFKKRWNYSVVAVASVGPGVPVDVWERWDQFEERVKKARLRPDGSKIAPRCTLAMDQVPFTRVITGRTTLKKKGKHSERVKIATGGTEKERATSTPLLPGDGVLGNKWGTITFHGAKPKPGKRLAKNTVAKELQDWKRHRYPAAFAYSCNKTAYFKEAECVMMIRLIRSNYDALETVLIADDYKWHKSELFIGGMAQINCTVVPVDGRMTFLCNPGDRFIHKLIKADSRISYEGWVLKQPLINGKLATPSRSQSAQRHYEAIKKLTPPQIERSIVSCRVLSPEDYSPDDCKRYGLHELKHEQAVRSIKEVLDDDELAAQLDYLSDDEAWLHEETTPHQPEGSAPASASSAPAAAASAAASASAPAPPPPPPPSAGGRLRRRLHLCLSTRWPSLSRGRLGL